MDSYDSEKRRILQHFLDFKNLHSFAPLESEMGKSLEKTIRKNPNEKSDGDNQTPAKRQKLIENCILLHLWNPNSEVGRSLGKNTQKPSEKKRRTDRDNYSSRPQGKGRS